MQIDRGGAHGGAVGCEKRNAVPTLPPKLRCPAVVATPTVPLPTSAVSTDGPQTGTAGTVMLKYRQRPSGCNATDLCDFDGFCSGIPPSSSSSTKPLHRAKTRSRTVSGYRLPGRLHVPSRRASNGRSHVPSHRRVSSDNGRARWCCRRGRDPGLVVVTARKLGFCLQTVTRVATVGYRHVDVL